MSQNKRSFFLKPSTRAFIKEARETPGYTFFDWLHGYIYSRWPYFYIGVGTGENRLSRFFAGLWKNVSTVFHYQSSGDGYSKQQAFADTYHGKVVPLVEAEHLVSIDKEIDLKDLEQIIPYRQARDIIMRNPDHIAVLECPCRAVRHNPCEPLDVCLIIGEPMAGFVVEHHSRRARWISRQEAVNILRAEHARGHVHHAFFKDAMLKRFYAICNCCSCCCGAMQAMRHGTPMLASSGYVSRADTIQCTGCGICVESCQFHALRLENDRVTVDEANCYGCGVCVDKCASEVFTLKRAVERGEPLKILELMAEAANHPI